MNIIRQSALKIVSGRKNCIAALGNQTCVSIVPGFLAQHSTNWAILHHAWGRISSALFKSASCKLCLAERWSQVAAWITPTPSLPLVMGSLGASTRPRWQPSYPYSLLCSLSACWRCTSTSQRDGEGSLPVD